MAITQIAFSQAPISNSAPLQAIEARTLLSQTITVPGVSTITSPLKVGQSLLRIQTDSQMVYVAVGPGTPNATTDANRIMVGPNTEAFMVVEEGSAVAVAAAP